MTGLLQMIVSRDAVPYFLVGCNLAGTIGLAACLHSFLKRTIFDSILSTQQLLKRSQLQRISVLFVSLFPAFIFPLAVSPLNLPAELKSLSYELSLVTSQILFLLLLINIVLPSLENWLFLDSFNSGGAGEEDITSPREKNYFSTKKKLFRVTKFVLFLISGFIILVDIGIISYAIRSVFLVVIGIGIVVIMRIILRLKSFSEKTVGTVRKQLVNGDDDYDSDDDPDYQVRMAIVELFLKIYSYQLNKKSGTPVKYSLVDNKSNNGRYTYDLHAKVAGDWKSRRMTIGRLGMDVISRSKCFFVIYGAYLVVKIPPEPITDIKKYIAILRKETRIASKLNLQDCIIPKLSVILKYVHHSFKKETTIFEEVETGYLKPLFIFSYLHNFLQINDSFVFFMDLSKYYFLYDAISKIHDSKESVYEEMGMDFEGYGSIYDPHKERSEFFLSNIAKAYAEYERRMKNIGGANEYFSSSSSWIKMAFFMRLAGYDDSESYADVPRTLSKRVNEIIDDIFLAFEPIIVSYQQEVKESVSIATFKKNKSFMEGIVTNLLNLLAWLGKKEVAVRDLKPDNLLVAGDRDMYPLFLADPQNFKIGLIDVETAVIFNRSHDRKIVQPQLGGTDKFATPSHFFDNQTIMQLFGDLSVTLHLQDWYAITAIIYNVIMGDFLFEKTSGFIPIIVREIGNSMAKGESDILLAQKLSILFWKQAVAEFDEKIQKNRQILEEVNIQLKKDVQLMFQRLLVDEYRETMENIKRCITTRKLFRSRKNRAYFSSLSNGEFEDLLEKLEAGEGVTVNNVTDRNEIIKTINEFSQLKADYIRCRKILKLFKNPTATVSAVLLLEGMFGVVRHNMWRQEWKSRDSEVVLDSSIDKEVRRNQGTVRATMQWQAL